MVVVGTRRLAAKGNDEEEEEMTVYTCHKKNKLWHIVWIVYTS
jgi:hypothetical protein